MAPKVGDTVFVAEHNELTGESSVSPAIVTYVYTSADGDGRWWQAAESKDIVDATVFRRGGEVVASTYGKSEEVTVDDGQGGTITYAVGYATTPDAHPATTTSSGTVTPTPTGAPTPVAAPVAQGLSDADIARIAAALKSDQAEPAPVAQGLSDADIARIAAALKSDQAEPAPADTATTTTGTATGDTTALPAT